MKIELQVKANLSLLVHLFPSRPMSLKHRRSTRRSHPYFRIMSVLQYAEAADFRHLTQEGAHAAMHEFTERHISAFHAFICFLVMTHGRGDFFLSPTLVHSV